MTTPTTPEGPRRPGDEPAGRVRLGPGVFVDASDIRFRAVSSGGPGGQNVNRRSTKVEARLDVGALPLGPGAMARLRRLAGSRLTASGELVVTSEATRSQGRNREDCMARLREMVARAVVPPRPRIPTKPTRGSRERRLDAKRRRSDLKRGRRPPEA